MFLPSSSIDDLYGEWDAASKVVALEAHTCSYIADLRDESTDCDGKLQAVERAAVYF
jgi:hypothetical protein